MATSNSTSEEVTNGDNALPTAPHNTAVDASAEVISADNALATPFNTAADASAAAADNSSPEAE